VQHGQRGVAPPAPGHRLVHLELVVEVEQLEGALAIVHQFEQPGRSLGVEQLGLHGDPARVGPGQPVGRGHVPRPGCATDGVMAPEPDAQEDRPRPGGTIDFA
jgi:hypothetical protein